MNRKEYYQENKLLLDGYYKTRRQKAPLYATWRSMMSRCGYIKGAKPHEVVRYINRGITICQEWRENFDAFQAWALSHGWRKGLQIDRIDNDGNYEPSNCRFVTAIQNCCNRSNTVYVEYDGRRMPLREAYDLSGSKVCYKNVNNRIRRGWPLNRALEV